MGLVDYGSDSDSENEDSSSPLNSQKPGPSNSNDVEMTSEDALDESVKPKAWEIELAEKAKKKLEKKAKKAAKKEKKAAKKESKEKKIRIEKVSTGVGKPVKEKGKVVIAAFGALGNLMKDADSDSDDDVPRRPTTAAKPTGFLSMLPAPKGKNNVAGALGSVASSMKPLSVARKQVKQAITSRPVPSLVQAGSDDSDDEPADFFGLSSSGPSRVEQPIEIPALPINGSMDLVGPSRPTQEELHPSQLYNHVDMPEEEYVPRGGVISDEGAHRLIMQYARDIGPGEDRSYNDMAANLVDVKVDDALGSDIKATVLKNLTHHAFMKSTQEPLPQPPGMTNQLARRKHQITYLANLAVSREEQLQEQWAQQKQTKRMGRAKYGF
ncbi:unnamed protein product [Caenorhabditis auriculariae]|uniref:Proline-rich protein PRCC n=1 Tax=Caenorhabditis auriculariae TaxID=2777116 RepID=A0A8S1HNC3_9PELO|nr:unnamed protein product [Caenorhabditis auriculariae]